MSQEEAIELGNYLPTSFKSPREQEAEAGFPAIEALDQSLHDAYAAEAAAVAA